MFCQLLLMLWFIHVIKVLRQWEVAKVSVFFFLSLKKYLVFHSNWHHLFLLKVLNLIKLLAFFFSVHMKDLAYILLYRI